MTVHTPGPWNAAAAHRTGIASSYVHANGKKIAAVWHRFGGYRVNPESYAEGRANANLIAAAPDLLAALRELHEAVGRFGWVKSDPKPSECQRRADIMNRARVAMAKATGGVA